MTISPYVLIAVLALAVYAGTQIQVFLDIRKRQRISRNMRYDLQSTAEDYHAESEEERRQRMKR